MQWGLSISWKDEHVNLWDIISMSSTDKSGTFVDLGTLSDGPITSGRCLISGLKHLGFTTNLGKLFKWRKQAPEHNKKSRCSRAGSSASSRIQNSRHGLRILFSFFSSTPRTLSLLAEEKLTSVVLLLTPSTPACSARHKVLAWSVQGDLSFYKTNMVWARREPSDK